MSIKSIFSEPGYFVILEDDGTRTRFPIAAVLREADIPSLSVSKITVGSGAFNIANIPSMGAGQITSGTLHADRIPSLDASTKITTGTITVGQLSSALLKYLLSVARVDYAHVDYCKVG